MYRWLLLVFVACTAAPRIAPDETRYVSSPKLRAAIHDATALDTLRSHGPLVESYPGDAGSRLVTFLFQSRARYVGMIGAPMVPERPMIRIGATDTYYLTARIPAESHFDYAFVEDNNPPPLHEPIQPGRPRSVDERYEKRGLDPNNPHEHRGSSRLDLPGPVEPGPWLAEDAATPHGTMTAIEIASSALGEQRSVSVYVSAGDATARRPVVIAFDGEDYGITSPPEVPLPRILDNLVAARRIPPVVLALVRTRVNRRRDLFDSPPFAQFVAKELVPRLQTDFNGTLDPAETIVTGSSAGGTAALYIGVHHADVVGNVLANSAALWQRPHQHDGDPPDYLEGGATIRELANSPILPLRLYIAVGIFENSLRDSNRQLRLVLEAKGYPHTYVEFAGGHDPTMWAHTLAAGLIQLLARR